MLERDGEGVALREGCRFVYGGDVVDHQPGDLRLLDELLALKRRFGERVQLVIGNRDVNKLRLPFELTPQFCSDWPLKEHPGVYWLTTRPRDSLPEKVLEENEVVEHLKWTGEPFFELSSTMKSQEAISGLGLGAEDLERHDGR